MFYVISGEYDPMALPRSDVRYKKLEANAWDAAQAEVVDLIRKGFGGRPIKIVHVIGECDFDPEQWVKDNPPKKKKTPTDEQIKHMYNDLGGEG